MPTYCDGTCSAGQEADAEGQSAGAERSRVALLEPIAEVHVVRDDVCGLRRPKKSRGWSPDTPVTVCPGPRWLGGIQTVAGWPGPI